RAHNSDMTKASGDRQVCGGAGDRGEGSAVADQELDLIACSASQHPRASGRRSGVVGLATQVDQRAVDSRLGIKINREITCAKRKGSAIRCLAPTASSIEKARRASKFEVSRTNLRFAGIGPGVRTPAAVDVRECRCGVGTITVQEHLGKAVIAA